MATRSAKIDQKADLIWAIADKLTGVYKPHEYGDVILPLTVIRRFDCILSDTKDAVLQKYDEVKNLPMKDILLRKASKKDFYNTSKYTFERLMDDPDHIEENFREYLNKFSANVRDIDKGGSRIAIIHNGSPLFTGDAGSGPSEIRRYILENDLLEAIIALPNDIFYNTGIATYIWVLSNKKAGTVREGKVQLINANEMFVKRRKALGNKRNDISKEDIAEITKIYGDFKESEISQIYDDEDFGYTKITVERPLRDEEGNLVLKKGKKQPDTSLRDTENVPLKEDIKEYFEREVLPFAPDAWVDEKKSKVGYEIPFTRYFYKYEAPRPSAEIMAEIMDLETELSGSLEEVFDL